MKPYFELVLEENSDIHVTPLFSDEEIEIRHKDYEVLAAKKFDYSFRYKAFEAVELIYFGEIRKIQYNFCIDPFCPISVSLKNEPIVKVDHIQDILLKRRK